MVTRLKDTSTDERLMAGAVVAAVAVGAATVALVAIKGKTKKLANLKPSAASKLKTNPNPRAAPKPRAIATPKDPTKAKTTVSRMPRKVTKAEK